MEFQIGQIVVNIKSMDLVNRAFSVTIHAPVLGKDLTITAESGVYENNPLMVTVGVWDQPDSLKGGK